MRRMCQRDGFLLVHHIKQNAVNGGFADDALIESFCFVTHIYPYPYSAPTVLAIYPMKYCILSINRSTQGHGVGI